MLRTRTPIWRSWRAILPSSTSLFENSWRLNAMKLSPQARLAQVIVEEELEAREKLQNLEEISRHAYPK